MEDTLKPRLALTVALVLSAAVARAEVPPGDVTLAFEGPAGPMIGPTIEVLGWEDAFDGPVVKGAPYSGEAVTEITRVLADGNRIQNRMSAIVHRDSEGRTRREETLSAVGAVVPVQSPPRMVLLNDPVAGVSYALELDRKIARKLPRRAVMPAPVARPAGGLVERAPGPPAARVEALGTRTVEGLEAQGTRSTTTLPRGAFGNEKPIVIVSERWVSTELQVVLESRRVDPLFGETRYRLTGISRSEPDRALFDVPPGFAVREMPAAPAFVPLRRP